MTIVLKVFLVASFTLSLGGLSVLTYQLAGLRPVGRPTLGNRGLKRARALETRTFRMIEPVLRYGAAWVETWSIPNLRKRIDRRLLHSGNYLGLSANELLTLAILLALALSGPSWFLSRELVLPVFAFLLPLLGLCAPWAHLSSVVRARAQRVDRGLPAAVDLASLCMSAGLDFPGSLTKIVETAADPLDPVIEEFGRVLQELELGYTRRRALEGLADRVPTEQVKEFVNSVVQAEEKGSPLASVLTIQSQTQRLRRSIAAEEAASGAALMLVGPMTLIFLCVILLLLGPLIVRFIVGDFGAP